ncbi:tetratricopeptide repeat protein [Streptomyces torulosus]|uniref:tetratricopeptide repeat protein n=1 Tax=Streptomyces torulosus TaxID=68276 RepID=UPI0006EBD13D|nr:tetratricopeptide repeat protein [Streptomyces torulosus]
MAPARPPVPTMQELIRRRTRQGFVGRAAERAAFRAGLDLPIEDERRRFLFHVHGDAGIGKTFLVRELEQIAREHGALTAYVDDGAGSVPEAMAVIADRFAREGRRFKELERLLTAHRERRYEAELAALTAAEPEEEAGDGPPAPSAASTAAARATLVALGLLPVVGPFAGAVDPDGLARGADRLWTGTVSRLRGQEDARLLLDPDRVLTPVLLDELAAVAAEVSWIVLLFDTYERTGPFLDPWLHDLVTGDRHGALPGNVVLVTAGRRPFDTARWGGLADFVADLPLRPFTETETRGLLAARGVLDEPVVDEVLRLTGGLPVLVSTLAEARPRDLDDLADAGDPSATAVERFLKWESDPVHRAAALACALPRWLDADVFRAAVAEPDADGAAGDSGGAPDALLAWLRALPFVTDRGDRIVYHDVVRAPMVRLQRLRSPRTWTERHRRLAAAFAGRRAATEAEAGLTEDGLWGIERWREARLAETYHLLCAGERGALPGALHDAVGACGEGEPVARRWAETLARAGRDADDAEPARWGEDLLAALARGGVHDALGALLLRAGLDARHQALAHALRGRTLHRDGANERAVTEFDRALALDPELVTAYTGRAVARAHTGDHSAAVADLDRADALAPDDATTLTLRGDYHRLLGNLSAAIADLDRAVALAPARRVPWASRGAARHAQGRLDEALVDLDRALELDGTYVWALVRRARVRRSRGEHERQLADLHHAVALEPDTAWVRCERGDALRVAGRDAEALADYDRAIERDELYASAYASRGVSLMKLGRHAEALLDLDRAVALAPEYTWALRHRVALHLELGDPVRALADAERALELRPDDSWAEELHGRATEAAARPGGAG